MIINCTQLNALGGMVAILVVVVLMFIVRVANLVDAATRSFFLAFFR